MAYLEPPVLVNGKTGGIFGQGEEMGREEEERVDTLEVAYVGSYPLFLFPLSSFQLQAIGYQKGGLCWKRTTAQS